MVYMKNISEINPLDYESYYFIGDMDNIELKFNTTEGMIVHDDYDVINTESGKIIAFPVRRVGVHNYICNDVNVSLTYFDQMFDILDKKEFEGFKFFILANSIELPSFEEFDKIEGMSRTVEGTHAIRCDYGKYGSFPFSIPEKVYVISKTFNPLNLAGVAHVAYLETLEKENQNPNHSSVLMSARSYSAMLKVIYEWAMVPDADIHEYAEISQKAKELWSSLNVPADLQDWLSTQYPAARLSKYLNGQPYKGIEHEMPEEMPEVLSNFIKSNCQYRTLTSLKNSHPSNVVIPQDILDSEKSQIDFFIYDLLTRNNIDYEDKKYIDIVKLFFDKNYTLDFAPNSNVGQMIAKTACLQRTL
jgi:hypothetical protein